jgi:HisJ family histidinol phosphate phosphatase
LNDSTEHDPRLFAIPDTHGHAKGEHKPYAEERPLPLTARMLFLWFYHAARRGYPRFLMVADHMNYLTFEDPAAVNLVRRALKLAQAGDLYGAAETANVDVGHAAVVSEGLRRGMRYSIGAEVDNDPRSRPDAQNIVDAMRPDAVIRSVHFIPITHPVHGENWNWPFDNPEFADLFDVVGTDALWESYVTILVDAIERLPGHIIGHFYVPAVFGHWPDDAKLASYEDRVLAAAAARGMAIEFNTRFLYRDHPDEEKDRYLRANRRLLRKAKERGVLIAIGSDAHSPRDQGNAFDIVLQVLDDLEINELVFPLGGSLRRVALRVVREPEPEPEPPPPPLPAPLAAQPKPPRAAPQRPAAKRSKVQPAPNGAAAPAPERSVCGAQSAARGGRWREGRCSQRRTPCRTAAPKAAPAAVKSAAPVRGVRRRRRRRLRRKRDEGCAEGAAVRRAPAAKPAAKAVKAKPPARGRKAATVKPAAKKVAPAKKSRQEGCAAQEARQESRAGKAYLGSRQTGAEKSPASCASRSSVRRTRSTRCCRPLHDRRLHQPAELRHAAQRRRQRQAYSSRSSPRVPTCRMAASAKTG